MAKANRSTGNSPTEAQRDREKAADRIKGARACLSAIESAVVHRMEDEDSLTDDVIRGLVLAANDLLDRAHAGVSHG